jgi:hypothetical protein
LPAPLTPAASIWYFLDMNEPTSATTVVDSAKKNLTLPTVHLNGTGRAGLTKLNSDAALAVQTAIDAVSAAAPHGRDYYPQDGKVLGPTYKKARTEHEERLAKLKAVLDDFYKIGRHLNEGGL